FLTKTLRLLISPNDFERSRSPAVVIGTSAISTPSPRSRDAASSACVSASLLPREPTRISTTRGPTRTRLAADTPASDPDERRRRLHRQRPTDELTRLQRSSARPER